MSDPARPAASPWRARPVARADAEALAALHADGFPGAGWSAGQMEEMLDNPAYLGLCVEDEDGAIGVFGFVLLRLAADEAEIVSIAVAPAKRRKGCGRALMGAAIKGAREAGGARLFLEVAVGNAAARALYESFGAESIGLRRDYYGSGRDAALYKLDLGAISS